MMKDQQKKIMEEMKTSFTEYAAKMEKSQQEKEDTLLSLSPADI